MGKRGLTADRSASGAMVNKIIRRVYMGVNPQKNTRQPKQNNYHGNAVSTVIMFNKWREAVKNDSARVVPKTPAPAPADDPLSFDVTPDTLPYGDSVGVLTIAHGQTPATGSVTPTQISKSGIISPVNYIFLRSYGMTPTSHAHIQICCSTGPCNTAGDGPFDTSKTYTVTITSGGVSASINVDSSYVPEVTVAASGYYGGWGQYISINADTTDPGAVAMKALIATIVSTTAQFTISFTEN